MATPAHYRVWPKGMPHAIRVPAAPLTHYLEVAALRYPDKPAIIFGGVALSYARLRERVEALAGHLSRKLGVRRGDRVLLLSQNCPQFVTAYYAILRAGAAVVPVNAMSVADELRYYIQDSGARVAVAAQELLPHLAPTLAPQTPDGLEAIVVHAYSDALGGAPSSEEDLPEVARAPRLPLSDPRLIAFEDAVAAGFAPPPEGPAPGDLCVLPYTSGTTGHPKGCRHTHATMLAAVVATQLWRGLHMETVFLSVAPLFHVLGMQAAMNVPISLGATVVMLPRWSPAAAARLIEQRRVSAWAAPPAMLVDFFSHPEANASDLSSLAMLSGGGAAMPESVAATLRDRYGLAYNEAYGMTEAAAFVFANPPARGKPQCLGVPTFGVEARIVDPATRREVVAGEVGELLIHGPQVMLGYWRNEAADAEAFVMIDGKRFLRTGDLVSVDPDGYFFMRDRLKRMINVSGYKVWPAEVESVMYQHPAVHEACIVSAPDAKRGETVKAILALKPAFRGAVSAQEIVDWSRERMAVYKAPRVVEFVDSLPKSATGKINWRQLQEAQREAAGDRPAPPHAKL